MKSTHARETTARRGFSPGRASQKFRRASRRTVPLTNSIPRLASHAPRSHAPEVDALLGAVQRQLSWLARTRHAARKRGGDSAHRCGGYRVARG